MSATTRPAAAIDGMEAADAVVLAARGRLAALDRRVVEAETAVGAARDARAALVARAAEGAEVQAHDLRACDDAIRDAESVHELRTAARPAVLAEVVAAEGGVRNLLGRHLASLARLASTRHAEAEVRHAEARASMQAAAERKSEMQRLIRLFQDPAGFGGTPEDHTARMRRAVCDLVAQGASE